MKGAASSGNLSTPVHVDSGHLMVSEGKADQLKFLGETLQTYWVVLVFWALQFEKFPA